MPDRSFNAFPRLWGLVTAFAPYNVILEEKKKTVQGTLDQFFKPIGQRQQPESTVDVDNTQPFTSAM